MSEYRNKSEYKNNHKIKYKRCFLIRKTIDGLRIHGRKDIKKNNMCVM